MSMQILTVEQLLEVFFVTGIYCVMTMVLPAVLLNSITGHMRFPAQFMIYQTVSSFYIILMVMLLQILHICSQLTLAIATALPFVIFLAVRFHRKGGLSKTQTGRPPVSRLTRCADHIWRNLPEIVLLFLVAAIAITAYDENVSGPYSYRASDLTAYNSWMYDMGQGETVADGTRPLWFYSVVWYLHTLLKLDRLMLFRGFWVIRTLLLYFMLLAFLRLCCKYKYTAYTGAGIYTLTVFLTNGMYAGESGIWFQESGMLFVLAPAAFLCLFFQSRKRELEEEAVQRQLEQEREEAEAAQERRVFLLDDLLAESAAQEKAMIEKAMIEKAMIEKAAIEKVSKEVITQSAGQTGTFRERPRDHGASGEVVLIMEENEADGTISIKECPLDGTISIQDTPINEIAEHAAEDIPLLDMEHTKKDKKVRKTFFLHGGTVRDSGRYLACFILASGMAVSGSGGQAAAAAIFSLAVCSGYSFRLLRPGYLWRVLLAGGLSAVCAAVPVFLAYAGGLISRKSLGMMPVRVKDRLAWNVLGTYLLHMVRHRQELVILLSAAGLLLLAVLFLALRRTDYGARMLSVVFFVAGLLLLYAGLETGILETGNGGESIRSYYVYSLVLVWGLCADGVVRLAAGVYHRLAPP